MPMNNRILRPLARPLLLDAVPGAAAAYSLRQLSNAYTGPVVTVRRSSDDAEADFKASEIDDGTLAAFCGAGDGLVKTWHDQSGNGRDASQGTAASQPKIVSSGSLVTDGGKAALEFDGTDDHLVPDSNIPSDVWDGDFSLFCVISLIDIARFNYIYSGFGTRDVAFVSFSTDKQRMVVFDGVANSTNTGTLAAGVKYHLNWIRSKSSGTFAYTEFVESDSTAYTGNAVPKTNTDAIGARYASDRNDLSANLQELLIYPSDQSANRQRIEGDIAWYY